MGRHLFCLFELDYYQHLCSPKNIVSRYFRISILKTDYIFTEGMQFKINIVISSQHSQLIRHPICDATGQEIGEEIFLHTTKKHEGLKIPPPN